MSGVCRPICRPFAGSSIFRGIYGAFGGSALPSTLLLAYYASNGGQVSKRGPQPTWSYAGALPNGQGGTTDGSVPPVHPEGVWVGPGYSNILLSGAEDFSGVSWTTLGGTVDGNIFTEDSSTGQHYLKSSQAVTVGQEYTLSVKVRRSTGSRMLKVIQFADYANFDLTTGAVDSSSGMTANIEAVGDNWYLVSVTFTPSNTQAPYLKVADTHTASWDVSYTGDGASSVEFSSPQLTQSPYLHPYIPPATSVVSAASTTGGNGPSFDISGTQEVPDGNELVANGDFTDGATGWSGTNASVSIVNEQAVVTVTSADNPRVVQNDIPVTIGSTYQVIGSALGSTGSASARIVVFSATWAVLGSSYDSEADFEITPDTSTIHVHIKPEGAGIGDSATFDNISVQKLTTVPEPKSLAVRRALEGKPDGNELWDDASATPSGGWVDNGDGTWTHSGTTTSELVVISDPLLVEDQRYIYDIDLLSGSAVNIQLGGPPTTVNKHTLTSASNIGVLPAEGTSTYNAIRVITSNDGVTVRINSVQKLNPAITTCAALVTMGVGSGELSNGTSIPVGSCNNSSHGGIYARKESSGIENSVGAWDGTTYLTKTGTWNRGEIHLKVVQTGVTGEYFRVGNKRYTSAGEEIDSTIQWSSWTAFDGSFDPLDYLRIALNNTVPMWLKGLEVWDKAATETEILKRLSREVLK